MANHVLRVFGSLAVAREGTQTPTDQEWDHTLDQLKDADFTNLRFLVWTDGAGPTIAQRQRLDQTLASRPVRVAVVTDSAKVRFIVSSIALFSREIRTFLTRELEAAYQYLGLSISERQRADLALREMEHLIR